MAETDNVIILYDGFRDTNVSERPTSSKTLMVRFALSIKGIQHKTFWVDWPDIAIEATKVGAPPTGELDGKPRYTVPFIYDPTTRTAISDSQKIIAYLETQYPGSPSLFPPRTRTLQAALVQDGPHSVESRILDAAGPLYRARVLGILTPRGREHIRKLYKRLGRLEPKELTDVEERKERIGEVLKVLGEINGWFHEDGADGPGGFLADEAPCNADVALAATLTSMRNVVGENSDLWQAILVANGGKWAQYMDLFKAWYHVV
ncbi:hypothetical protein K488DRAFT_71168 [Vararia minispora EC-137]|uniref:Uncharacterized protein n=1 Tax=Vararia minispora EC-137 TaxID=1314806 RepID=A0ACB8QJ95_9AGAM|nr:hypothetical protein K488DRAFT_71168 [Vararia minispora EC-137]